MNFDSSHIRSDYFVCYSFICKIFKYVYRLCNFNHLQMSNSYIKQSCCPIMLLGNNSDVFLEISSITNASSVRINI